MIDFLYIMANSRKLAHKIIPIAISNFALLFYVHFYKLKSFYSSEFIMHVMTALSACIFFLLSTYLFNKKCKKFIINNHTLFTGERTFNPELMTDIAKSYQLHRILSWTLAMIICLNIVFLILK